MLKPILTRVFGTRHERGLRRIEPIVQAIEAEDERLQGVSEDELRAQTEKLRGIVRERTGELEVRIAELKERKRVAKEAAEREEIDNELMGADGRSGLEGELRRVIAETLDEILP